MPAVDDEESLSDVNKQVKLEMEAEELGVLGIESAENCESIPELGESSVIAGWERDETASLEDNPVAVGGGGEGLLENHVEGCEPELIGEAAVEMVEMPAVVMEKEVSGEGDGELTASQGGEAANEIVEMPAVVAEEVVAEEGGGELITSQGEASLELKAVEGAKRIDDSESEATFSDTGSGWEFTESQVDKKDDELQLVSNFKLKAQEEVEPVVTDSESRKNARGDGIPVDPQPETITEKVFKPVDDPKMEVVDTHVGCKQHLTELEKDVRGGESEVLMEGIEAWKNEPEKEFSDKYNVDAAGGAENESVERLTLENNAKGAVQDDLVDEEKVDVVVNDSEIGTAEKPVGIEEEKGTPWIAEEIPITEVKRDCDMITEVNACFVNVIEKEQVRESSNGMEYASGGERSEHPKDEEMTAEESLMVGPKMVDDDKLSKEVLSDAKLDEPLGVAEYKVDVLATVEPSAEDVKQGTEATVGLESTRNAVMEDIQSTDAEVETEKGSYFIADKTPDKDGKLETDDTISDMDEPGEDIYDSPAALQDKEDEAMVAEETGSHDTEMETETDVAESGKTSVGKRKRGKLSKSPPVSKPTAKASSRKTVGDDVCFICFDGGELVLCDRRGCPKAYHPSCVNRDESFFRSKGRWNCGWHLCSICEKNARYMCYTCTFSLCKSCIKDAVILCVRGNKGFCKTCMRTVMLIEKNEQGSKDTQIDFDDRSSWEYLFKDYYIELKAKLSLSSVEIAEAKNPWKGMDFTGPSKPESSDMHTDANDGGTDSDDSIEKLKTSRPKRRKIRKQSKSLSKKEELVGSGVVSGDKASSSSDNFEWASRELLEFVSHMKSGDTSVLSQFDVQALLLEYIKKNKLRDPRRKSHIICDVRLENLFGKPRVGHFEMLKLLESHFLVRDEQNDDFQGSVVDTDNIELDIDVTVEPLSKGVKDRKRKSRKKSDSRGPQSNLDDYAAIDMHNIGLIYLRRKLMEDLLEDAETFHDRVIGTFVRIRISGSTQKQDLYRLVQVVGTSKVAEPYKVGKKTTDIMVEILNLDKTEIISIDTISNQEFTEEECKRLRQSIKCGLISRLTVGEILDKTMELQVARVNDWLESETLRLSHLRDRASDLGRRKELRECVEKLQLLKTPEERRRRLEEIPEIHADPKMDPSYESDDNDSENEDTRQDAFMRSRGSGFSRRGRGPVSPVKDNSVKDSWSGAGKVMPSRNISGNNFSINSCHIGEIVNENSWNIERDKERQESNNLDKLNSATKSESAEWALRNLSRSESFSSVASVPPQGSNSAGAVEPAVKINESEKMWQYQDPSGKVQGPFSVVQLRKWNNTGYFPTNLKIWRTTEKQENSILLTDALAGKFLEKLPAAGNMSPTTNTLHSSHALAGHSGNISGTLLYQEKERSNPDQNSGSLAKLSADKWTGSDVMSLPSPTPKQSNSGWTGGEAGVLTGAVNSPAVNGVLPSPTAVLPSIGPHSIAPASVMNSVVETTAFSPTPNSQQGIVVGSAVSLRTQSTAMSESHVAEMQAHPPAAVQPAQSVSQNLLPDTQVWGSSAQAGQPQGYDWTTSNVQISSGSFSNSGPAVGIQPDVWRPTQSSQPSMHPPITPNASWAMGSMSTGARPQNPNVGWGTMPANPNMGWGSPVPGNTNINWGPAMQAPPSGNTSGWGPAIAPPPGNTTGANMPAMLPGKANPDWVATQGWGAPPVQGPAPGNGLGPPSGPGQGNSNQGWGAPSGNQGPWGGEQNYSAGQFSGQRVVQGRDSGFSGGRPWNRQSSFGGGGSRHNKREMLCPYNANGRCKKGARCDYLHT